MAITRSLYTSEGDNGAAMMFDLEASDTSKSVDLTFNDVVFIKSGHIMTKDAPFGATLDIEVIHPVDGKLFDFGRAIPLFGTTAVPLSSDEIAEFPAGLILRITANNAATGVSFQVTGHLEIIRTYTE